MSCNFVNGTEGGIFSNQCLKNSENNNLLVSNKFYISIKFFLENSLLAKALNDDNIAMMASLDLSAAFDVVNFELEITTLKNYWISK